MKFKNREYQLTIQAKHRDRPNRHTVLDVYRDFPFKDKIPTKKQFSLIAKVYFSLASRFIIETGKGLKLPQKVGVIIIKKSYSDKLIMNYPLYKKQKDIVLSTASRVFPGSKGWVARFYWDKTAKYCNSPNKNIFRFIPIRGNKVRITQLLKTTTLLDKYNA